MADAKAVDYDPSLSPFEAAIKARRAEQPSPTPTAPTPPPTMEGTVGNASNLDVGSGAKRMSDMLLGQVEIPGGAPPIPTVEPIRPQKPPVEISRTPGEIAEGIDQNDPTIAAQVQAELEELAKTIPSRTTPSAKPKFIPEITLEQAQVIARSPAGQEAIRRTQVPSKPFEAAKRRKLEEAEKSPTIPDATTPTPSNSGSVTEASTRNTVGDRLASNYVKQFGASSALAGKSPEEIRAMLDAASRRTAKINAAAAAIQKGVVAKDKDLR